MTASDDPPSAPEAGARPFPDSLCWQCTALRVVRSARSVFVMCQALPIKYPRQPVAACPAFEEDSTDPIRHS